MPWAGRLLILYTLFAEQVFGRSFEGGVLCQGFMAGCVDVDVGVGCKGVPDRVIADRVSAV